MISVVCWKWSVPDRPADFKAEYVNTVRAMFARHYPDPFRFICVTDDGKGLDANIEVLPTPPEAGQLGDIPAPRGVRFPSSYRRLWNFSAEAREAFGPRIFAIDIDIIFTADLRPLLSATEDFVSWYDPRFKWKKIPGGIYLHRTGTLPHVWESFDPATSPGIADRAGTRGSDQGWMSYLLWPAQKAWTVADGVYSIKWISESKPGQRPKPLPNGVRVVSTPGELKPWDKALQKKHPWIREHWRL